MRLRRVAGLLFVIALQHFLLGQSFAPGHQASEDALSNSETEEVRRVADMPPERVKLYMRFLDERSAKISELKNAALVEHRGPQLHDAIERFAGLADELQDNLDEYQEYETNHMRPVPDLRKVLPELKKSVDVWQTLVDSLPANADYDFARESADDSLHSLKDQTTEMIAVQAEFFAEKKQQDKARQKQAEQPYVLP